MKGCWILAVIGLMSNFSSLALILSSQIPQFFLLFIFLMVIDFQLTEQFGQSDDLER